jgi:hypothetical protein
LHDSAVAAAAATTLQGSILLTIYTRFYIQQVLKLQVLAIAFAAAVL